MGQKTNPIGLRLGINRTWDSRWYADKDYAKLLHSDIAIMNFIRKKLHHAGISRVVVERAAKKVKVNIYTARPGIIIGKRGLEVENLKQELKKYIEGELQINIIEVRKPELDAQLVSENVALQLVRRVSYRRAMKKAVVSVLKFGAKGVKISCSGRLGGSEIARSEWYREGIVPLHTFGVDIDYGFYEAKTTYGMIGVKVWICKGEAVGESQVA